MTIPANLIEEYDQSKQQAGGVPSDLIADFSKQAKPDGYGLLEAMAHAATLGTSGPITALTHALLMKHVNGDPRPLGEIYGEAVTQGQGKREAYEAQQSTPGAIAEGVAGALPFMALPEAAGVGKGAGLIRTVLEGGAKAGLVGGTAAAIKAGAEAPVGQTTEAAAEAFTPGALIGGMVGATFGPLAKIGKFGMSRFAPGKAAAAKREIATALGLSEGEMQGAEQRVLAKQAAGTPISLAQLHPEITKPLLLNIAEKSSPETRKALQKFIAQQADEAAPLYDAAFGPVTKLRVVTPTTPEAQLAMADPEINKALDVARFELKRKGVNLPIPNPQILAAARQMQQRNPALLNSPANAAFKQALQQADEIPVMLVDRAKQVLDRTIHRRPTNTDEAKVLATTKAHLDALLGDVKQQVPEYDEALSTAATYKQLGDAVRTARKARVQGVAQGGGIGHLRPIGNVKYGAAVAAARALEAISPSNAQRLGPDFLKLLLTGSGGQLGGQSLGGPQELLGLLQTLRNIPQQGVSGGTRQWINADKLIPGVGGYAGSRVGGQ